MDVVIASSALIALLPFFVILAFAIMIESPGKPVFSQYRWGKDGRRIRIYKFRTMRIEKCDQSGVAQTEENDPRVTRLGRFLRPSGIDELPQLVNVIRGDMSLVGPRCHVVGMLATGVPYEKLVPYYHERHSMRPGITGLAQIRGWRGPTRTALQSKARIESDIFYVNNFSLWLDVKIILETVRREIIGGNGF